MIGAEALMRYTRLGDTLLIRVLTGQPIVESLLAAAGTETIEAATVSGIGAAYDLELGYFDRAARQYVRRRFPEELEIVSLSGTLALKEGRPFAHLHVTLSRPDFTTLGGHLFEGRAGATVELVVRQLPGKIRRALDEATGLYLWDLEELGRPD
jgi:predicted DNA-binding protein with PD1-like motif